MSGEGKPESVLVMPVKGKYSEIVLDNKTYQVWKVHPNTPERLGTLVPYDVAVYFLGKVPPIITLVPNIVEGAHVSPLLPEDIEKIRSSLERGFVGGIANYNFVGDAKQPKGGADAGSDQALKQALDLLARQTEQNQLLRDTMAEEMETLRQLQEKVAVLEAGTSSNAGGASVPPQVVVDSEAV
jgi:hypothetical protein